MKVLAILILASLPVPQVQPSRTVSAQPQPHFAPPITATQHKRGQWYLARTGHAVYCYGPVMTLPNKEGEIERVATFCRGDQLLVPLKD